MEDNVLQLIENSDCFFSKTEKIIASYIKMNPEQIAILSLSSLSAMIGVGEATIVRFCKKIGLSGFLELKKLFKQRFSASFNLSSRFYNYVNQNQKIVDSINSYIDLQKSYIEASKSIVTSPSFNEACRLINSAETLFLFEDGGASKSPGNTLNFWLSRFGINVCRINQLGHRIFDQIIQHGNNDCFISFCFGKDNNDLLKLLKYCNKYGVSSIVITDYPDGYVAAIADYVLELERGSMEIFHSMAVPVLISEAISLFVSDMRKDETYKNLRELDEVRKEFDV